MRGGIILSFLFATVAGFSYGTPPPTEEKKPEKRPLVEVAFVLDSTGSMSGLIEGAKEKIWAIANEIVTQKPEPDLKIGLLTYRDKGDEYVTKSFDLTDDLDAIYGHLQGIRAGGGGDTPESVNQALHEAVTKMSWTPVSQNVYRVIFLVGDAPPHMDYPDDVKYPESCKRAADNGIIINTIQCGSIASCTQPWQEIALKGEGNFTRIMQSGNVIVIETPYDKEIAELTRQLEATVIPYGSAAQQTTVFSKLEKAGKASFSANADRASFNKNRGGAAIQGRGDLVQDIKNEPKLLEKSEELPENMQKMSLEERQKYVEEQTAKRAELNRQIGEITAKRAQWMATDGKKLRAEASARAVASPGRRAAFSMGGGAMPAAAAPAPEAASEPSASFDESVTETIRTQFKKASGR